MIIGILAFFLVTLFIISRIRYKLSLFSELNYLELRREGKKIKRHFQGAGVQRILLYRYQAIVTPTNKATDIRRQNLAGGTNVIDITQALEPPEPHYVLVFHCRNPRAGGFRRCTSMVNAIQDDIKRWQVLGIGESFKGVYRQDPPANYLEKWRFYAFTRYERALHISNRAHWVVWPRLGL